MADETPTAISLEKILHLSHRNENRPYYKLLKFFKLLKFLKLLIFSGQKKSRISKWRCGIEFRNEVFGNYLPETTPWSLKLRVKENSPSL